MYSIGSKVAIITKKNKFFNRQGCMNKWLGKTMTIEKLVFDDEGEEKTYRMKESSFWKWNNSMIDHEATQRLNKSI